MEQDKTTRLRTIRNLAALGLLETLEYSDCLAQIQSVASGKTDVIVTGKAPAPERKKRGTRDRKERSGQDRDEE